MIPTDHFSDRAALYAVFRPTYPGSLFDALAGLAPRRSLALDCGTGNGQAAVGLARRFERVVATDRSAGQLAHAVPAHNVIYRQAAAETSGLPDKSVDLVTAAQALHWFDIPAFFTESRRVLVPMGVLAVWGYGDPTVDDPRIQSLVHAFNRGTLEEYWPAERRLLLAGYRTIEFPFDEIPLPAFSLEQHWSLSQLTGLMRTWSASSRFAARHGRDPVADIESELGDVWGDPDAPRLIRWPLFLRAGRVDA